MDARKNQIPTEEAFRLPKRGKNKNRCSTTKQMKNMEIQFVIVRSENREYLCYKAEDVYVDVSNPMMTFTDGEV